MRGLYSHSREYRKIFSRSYCPNISHIWEGIHFGGNTCRACIRTCANTGKYSWGLLIMYWFRARGYVGELIFSVRDCKLSGPISRDIAIVSLRYPLSRDTFSAIAAIPQQGAIPCLGAFFYTDISVRYPILQHIARYLCDTPGKQA